MWERPVWECRNQGTTLKRIAEVQSISNDGEEQNRNERWSTDGPGSLSLGRNRTTRIDVGFVSTTLPPSLPGQQQRYRYTWCGLTREGGAVLALTASRKQMGMREETLEAFSRFPSEIEIHGFDPIGL